MIGLVWLLGCSAGTPRPPVRTDTGAVDTADSASTSACDARATVVGTPCGMLWPAMEWRGEGAGDWSGDTVGDAGDLDGNGRAEITIAGTRRGAARGVVYVVEAAGPGVASLSEAPGRLVGASAGDGLGYDIAAVPGGILVGAAGVGENAGAAYRVPGPVIGAHVVAEVAILELRGAPGDKLASVASAGDIDGDGTEDLVVGANGDGPGGVGAGYAAVISGHLVGVHDLALAATCQLVGVPGANAGKPGSVGDLDGDGLGDLVVGAEHDTAGGPDAGAVYVMHAPLPSGIVRIGESSTRWLGRPGSIAGHAVDGLGDADGDGRADLVVGAPYDDPAGAKSGSTYVVPGTAPSGPLEERAVAVLRGDDAGIRAGYSVAWAHDLDADGFVDLAIGAKFDRTTGTAAGAVYLVTGPFAGDASLAEARLKVLGQHAGDHLGDVSAVRDADGDGAPDLLMGARHHGGAGMDAGAAWVLFGGGW